MTHVALVENPAGGRSTEWMEAVTMITHLAFYTGWPNAVTAVSVAREVFQEN